MKIKIFAENGNYNYSLEMVNLGTIEMEEFCYFLFTPSNHTKWELFHKVMSLIVC